MNEHTNHHESTRSSRNPERSETRQARKNLKGTLASLRRIEGTNKTSASQYFALEFMRLHEEFRDRGDLNTNEATQEEFTTKLDALYADLGRFPKAKRTLLKEVGIDKDSRKPITVLEALRKRVYGEKDSIILFKPRRF